MTTSIPSTHLIDYIGDVPGVMWGSHYITGSTLTLYTDDDLVLIIQLGPRETEETLTAKIQIAHDKAIEELESEKREDEIEKWLQLGMWPQVAEYAGLY